MSRLPALALAAVPGRRLRTIELAREIERRGYSGIFCASFGDAMGLCVSMAHATERIPFGTAIVNLYTRNPSDLAQSAAYLHEISGGRFTLGIGVSHAPMNARLGVTTGRPLSDVRDYVEKLRKGAKAFGEMPPIALAALRRRMAALAGEIGDGAVWANASRSHMAESLAQIPAARRGAGFFVGDMIPTCVDDDRAAAAERCRRTLVGYVSMPNYRNYWREAGYEEEMDAVEAALDRGDRDGLTACMSDRWLADSTLFGSATEVRDGVDAWHEAGVSTPILVPSSTRGGQLVAFEELFAVFG